MPDEKINLLDKFTGIDQPWSPRVIAELNDYQFKIAKFEGEFTWHHHDDTDEAFIVVEGTMSIALRDRTVTLTAGEMFVVPKGVEHKPFAEDECKVLMIEPRGTVNTGEAGGDLTAENDVWI